MMQGLMQMQQLTTAMLIRHAAANHPRREIVSVGADGGVTRSDWGSVERRARRIAAMLVGLGLSSGDRVATLAWNRLPHLELYYGVTAAGMVLHTVNPRLFPDQIRYILDHGGASVLCIDPDLLPIIEPLLLNKPRGVARVDDRWVLNSILWRLRTGCPWAEVPECYGDDTVELGP